MASPALQQLIAAQSGIVTTAQSTALVGEGITRGHVNVGRWQHVCQGILATHNGRHDHRQHLWVAVLIAGTDAALAGTTALTEAGVQGLRDGPIQVLIPAPRNRSRRLPQLPADMPAIRVIRTRYLPAEHRQHGSPPRTTTARAAVDAAIWAPGAEAARVALAATCQQRKAEPQEIFEVLAVRRGLPRLK